MCGLYILDIRISWTVMTSLSLMDYVVKRNHLIYHSNEDNLERERGAINYARTNQSRTVPGKLA